MSLHTVGVLFIALDDWVTGIAGILKQLLQLLYSRGIYAMGTLVRSDKALSTTHHGGMFLVGAAKAMVWCGRYHAPMVPCKAMLLPILCV